MVRLAARVPTSTAGEVFPMDIRYINPFIKSIRNTFETMCKTKVEVGRPELKVDDKPYSDVSSVIGFSGDAAGSVVLHFSFEVASKLATAFAGVAISPDHEDFPDALGELANMVAGGAKAYFEGIAISISLPSIVMGARHRVSASRTAPRIVVPCHTEVGDFIVEIGMELGKPATIATVIANAGVDL